MAFNAGNAFVTVTPRFISFQTYVRKEMNSVMPAEGRTAGNAFGRAMTQGAQAGINSELPALKRAAETAGKTVQTAAEKSVKARDAAADAAGKLRVAEEKLNQVRASSKTTPDQLAAAEERVASAQRRVQQTTYAAETAQKNYVGAMKTSTAAHETLQKATEESERATKEAANASSNASKKYANGWRGVGQRVKGFVQKGVKSATDAATKQAETGGRRAGSGYSSAFKAAAGALAVGFSVSEAFQFGKQSVDLAGQAEQSIGAIDTVFKENAQQMHEWAKTASETVGLSSNEYREFGTLLGSQLKNMGTPMDAIADKSNGLIAMGADMASMFGGTTKEAIEAISSALKGEMDPIERYGITLSAAALEAEALSKNIIKPVVDSEKVETAATKMTLAQSKYNEVIKKHGKDSDEAKRAQLALTSAENAYEKATAGKVPQMDAESKALAVQSALYAQSADAQGNFMREEGTFEHQRQVALTSWADLKTTIGTAFLPMLTKAFVFVNTTAIPALESFTGWVGSTADSIGQTLGPILQGATGWIQDNSTAVTIGAGVIGALMVPMLVRWGVQATIAGAKNVAAFLVVKAEAIKTAAIFVAQSYKMIGSWAAMSAAAVGSGIKTAAVWTGTIIRNAVVGAATFAIQSARIIGSWVAMSAAAVASGIKTAAVWTGTVIRQAVAGAASFSVQAGKIIAGWVLMATRSMIQALKMALSWSVGVIVPAGKAAVAMGIQSAKVVAKWVLMGTQSLLQAGRMAAAWLIAMGPIGWAIAAVVGIAAIVIANWSKIKKWTIDTWNSVSGKIRDVWNNNIKPIFQALGSFIQTNVKPAFQRGIDGIKKIWNTLEGIAKAPVKFMVETVINKGLIDSFNKVAGFIKIGTLEHVKLPAGFADGGWTGPGHKYQEAGIVHADEFVVKKSSRRRIERRAPGFLDSLNQFGDKALGYANGGLVRPLRGGRVSSGFGASRGRYPHAGQDFATPVGTPIYAAMDGTILKAGWNAITGRTGIGAFLGHEGGRNTYYGHLSRLLVKVGDMVKQGQKIAFSGNTGRSTGPHLHFETWTGGKPVDPAPFLGGAALPEGAGGGGWNPIQSLLDVGGKIKGWFSEKFPDGGKFLDAAVGFGSKIFTDLKDWAWSKLATVGDFAKDSWSNVKGFFTGGKSKAKEAVQGVAGQYGWGSGDQWDALQSIIQKESSWKVDAANSSSSARGLFQKMTSLHGPVESTAEGQAKWGLNYIKQRYGNPMNAWTFHQKHGSYAAGGQVKPIQAFAKGGLARGLSLVGEEGPELVNFSSTARISTASMTEKILSNTSLQAQLAAISGNRSSYVDAILKSIEATRATPGTGNQPGTYIGNIQLPQGATVSDLTRELRFAHRVNGRGGKRQ
ncbi:peptidoglycan DD-metalloendopeptidase family protein [Arthrobacter sp. JUb115]|uniref:aggregation-promoting factor C-terminal-like domain-containing protein n=1 Tax=Arthrobacter sp. JUb115 TaxID=2485108 RepID=UPI00105E1CE7|nr:peptidoglycan DD-metalloendopeptidase family protein [Arthrobacter sp. JUb115]TDU27105.1 peptidase M23-like protein [Arthrobacter sp. JUb115]